MAGVTMSIHKLTAGSGYDYLTRQVAAFDATEKGHVPLASYHTERGESPGVWIGSGLTGIDGLKVGDPVTAVRRAWRTCTVGTPSREPLVARLVADGTVSGREAWTGAIHKIPTE